MTKGEAIVMGIIQGAGIEVGLTLLFSLPAYLFWNWLMPEIFGLPTLTYWQALGLAFLARFLIK